MNRGSSVGYLHTRTQPYKREKYMSCQIETDSASEIPPFRFSLHKIAQPMFDLSPVWLLLSRMVLIGETVDPNDPLYKPNQKSYLEAINLPEAWDTAHARPFQKLVKVALIDSGIRADHEDLNGNILAGYNVMDKNNDTHDGTGHGTAMAGVVGAITNNGKGIAGITDHVKLVPIRVYGKITFRDFSNAVDYAVNSKVDLIILAASWKKNSALIEASIAKATLANIPFVCAAGNHGTNIALPGETTYPCEYSKTSDGIICVAGTKNADMKLHKMSNYAPFVDVAAPANVWSTTLSGGYRDFAGTSGSAAVVAGVISLLKSVAPRSLSVKEIKSIIRATSTLGVTSYDGKTQMAFGRLDALKAVETVLGQRALN